jgi:hypothetical protein
LLFSLPKVSAKETLIAKEKEFQELKELQDFGTAGGKRPKYRSKSDELYDAGRQELRQSDAF